MALPLVPLLIVVGSVASAAGGVALGAVGGVQVARAQKRIKRHAERYEARHREHLGVVEATNGLLQSLGDVQENAQRNVIDRMKAFLVRNAKQVRAYEHLVLEGVNGANERVVGVVKLDPDVAGWVRGVVGSALAGAGTPVALRGAAATFARASTGSPIAGLHGAAAKNATLAFLGGGSLSSGGGGVKLGRGALGVAAIGPAVLIAGITMKNQGTKSRTDAARHQTEVDVEIARLDGRDSVLSAVGRRAEELSSILHRLTKEAVASIDRLESEPFDMTIHGERFQTALTLVKSVRDVATAPVANEHGEVDESTDRLIFIYRGPQTEVMHG
jgi:hypothetical protein